MYNMLIRPTDAELESFGDPDFTIINAGLFAANRFTVGLTSAGMSAQAAVAAVLLYRIATYYLPPVWGFVALQWLQRNRYL